MRNRYYRRSKLSAEVFREILKYFCLDLSASDAARLSGVSIRSVNDIYLRLRERLAELCEAENQAVSPAPAGGEASPEASRVPASSSIVFGLRRRVGGVQAELLPQPWPGTLAPLIRGKAGPEATAELERWRGYTCLVDVSSEKLLRLDFATGADGDRRALDEMEGFWSYAKRRLSKFNGVPSRTFHLHLKECEYRFNRTGSDLYADLLKMLRDNPL